MEDTDVSIRDLRNHGGDLVARATAGEDLTITRSGRPVARLTALPRPPLAAQVLVDRRRNLPTVDPDRLRDDLDAVIDPAL